MFTITVDVYTYKDTHTYEMADTHSRLFALQGLRLHGLYVDVVKDSCLRMKKPLESLDKTEKNCGNSANLSSQLAESIPFFSMVMSLHPGPEKIDNKY